MITNSNNLSLYYYEFRNQTQISSVKGLYRKMIPVDSKKKKITEKLPNDGPNCLHFFYKGKCALLVEKKLTLTKELGAYKELTILSMQNKDPSLKNKFEDLCSREQQLVKHISVLEEQLLKTCDQVEYVGGKERTEAFYVSLVGTLDAYNLEHNSRDATYNIPSSLKCCPYSGGSDIVIWREGGVLCVNIDDQDNDNSESENELSGIVTQEHKGGKGSHMDQICAEGITFASRLLMANLPRMDLNKIQKLEFVSAHVLYIPVFSVLQIWKVKMNFVEHTCSIENRGNIPWCLVQEKLPLIIQYMINKLSA